MPAVSGAGGPSRSQIENWDVEHLEAAATHWAATAQVWEEHYTAIHEGTWRPGGAAWEGSGAEAAQQSTFADLVKVRGAADGLHSGARIALNGAGDLVWAKDQVLSTIAAAEAAQFKVGQDLSVRDPTTTMLMSAWESRQAQAKAFAAEISTRVQALFAIDQQVATEITGALAPVESLAFPGNQGNSGPAATAVDYHRFKQEPGPVDPNDPNRHALYPNRNPWGLYGPDNQGDGKAAEKAALDELQRNTGIPIIRQQVQATHPGVDDPVTGKPQPRYYDGLMPTGVPNQYIGIEAKTHEGVKLTPKQSRFDAAVSAEHPAMATLNGQPIEIVGTRRAEPPAGWVPPPPTGAPVPAPGLPGLPPPPVMRRDDGGPLIPSAGSNPAPNWGTHISPDELAKSGDPELSNLGKFFRGMFPHVDPSDPDNTA